MRHYASFPISGLRCCLFCGLAFGFAVPANVQPFIRIVGTHNHNNVNIEIRISGLFVIVFRLFCRYSYLSPASSLLSSLLSLGLLLGIRGLLVAVIVSHRGRQSSVLMSPDRQIFVAEYYNAIAGTCCWIVFAGYHNASRCTPGFKPSFMFRKCKLSKSPPPPVTKFRGCVPTAGAIIPANVSEMKKMNQNLPHSHGG